MFWKICWVMSIPLFMVSLAMAVRTVSIHTNDLFHFGRGRQWWCYAIVSYGHLSASWEVYEPGYVGGWVGVPPGQWFFYHLAANGGTWSVTGASPVETSRRDYGVFGFITFEFRGKPAMSVYWINLGPILPLCTLLSGGILAVKFYHMKRTHNRIRMGKCPHCSYDLRAHHPGEKCPECGTVIVAKNPSDTATNRYPRKPLY
jgi:hypothetical protein